MAKRLRGYLERELLPFWTCQGYVGEDGHLRRAGIVETTELMQFIVDRPAILQNELTNSEDGARFVPIWWSTLKSAAPSQRLIYVRAQPYTETHCGHRAARYYSDQRCGDEWRCLVCWQEHAPTIAFGQQDLFPIGGNR